MRCSILLLRKEESCKAAKAMLHTYSKTGEVHYAITESCLPSAKVYNKLRTF